MSDTITIETELLLNLKKYIDEYISLKECQCPLEKNNFPPNPLIRQSHIMLQDIKKRLSHICNHKIVEDIIDVDYDRSITVYYCEFCETTFGSDSNNLK